MCGVSVHCVGQLPAPNALTTRYAMTRFVSLLLLVIPFSLAAMGCSDGPTDRVVTDFDEAEMDAAIKKAQGSLSSFIEEFQNPTGEDHAVKVGISDDSDEHVEYFWLSDLKFDGTTFTGTINNEPQIVTKVSEGQRWSVRKDEVIDWLFMKDGRMHGNHTVWPLIDSLPPDEAAALKALMAKPNE